MISSCLASIIIITSPVSQPDYTQDVVEMRLSDKERSDLYLECHFAVKKMYSCMNQSEIEAGKIKDIDLRLATEGAIEGAICGLSGRTPYSVVIGACLGSLAKIGGDSYRRFCISRDYVYDAEAYAKIAEEIEERLWRDCEFKDE